MTDWISGLWDKLWDPISTTFGVLAAALGSHGWRRWRNRLAVLRWGVTYSNLGASGEDLAHGSLEIRHNGQLVRALTACVVQIENESNRDLNDLEIVLTAGTDTRILTAAGAVRGSSKYLAWTDEFRLAVDDVIAASERGEETDASFLLNNRRFRVHVLNRNATVEFQLLAERVGAESAIIQVSCDHLGVRTIRRPERPQLFGVSLARALTIGLAAGIAATFVVAHTPLTALPVAFLSFALGLVVTLLGVGIVWLGRIALRFLN